MHHLAQPSYLLYDRNCTFPLQTVGNKTLVAYDRNDPFWSCRGHASNIK
jgi:hypothetical protein